MVQQLEHLTKTNTTLQSSYRSMTALCDEARLKLTMQRDSIESSIALLTKLKATLTTEPEVAEKMPCTASFNKMMEIQALQREIIKATSELHSLTTISSNSILED